MNTTKLPGARVTPLGIVATFVTLTEAVLGYAVTQTEAGVQIALTAFVICFALLVFGAFFLVLWNRPYVFYPPSEYGDSDPNAFVDAMSKASRKIDDQRKLVERATNEPNNPDAMFPLMDTLIDDSHRQMIILMHDKNFSVPYLDFGGSYELAWKSGKWSGGGFSAREFARKLDGTELLQIEAAGPTVRLTPLGHEFGRWLIENNKRADFFETPFGSWGERFELEGLDSGMREQAFQRMGIPRPTPIASTNAPSQPDGTASPSESDAQKGPD